MAPDDLDLAKLPSVSLGVDSIRASPRSSATRPRVIGLDTSDNWRIGAMIISMAGRKATNSPTDVPLLALCASATEITADKATAASIWVIGVMAGTATA